MYKCMECGSFFSEQWAIERPARLEDGVAPYEKIIVCPCCGSDETVSDICEGQEDDF